MKNFHKMETPPPYCICEILIQIFYRKFRDKIKMRQNSVNHSKFRFSKRLMQGITLLHYYQTHQGILFWPKTCHFELLNFWIRVWKQTDPPPMWDFFSHKNPTFFKMTLPLLWQNPTEITRCTAPTWKGDLNFSKRGPDFEWKGDLWQLKRGPKGFKSGPKKRIFDKLTETC